MLCGLLFLVAPCPPLPARGVGTLQGVNLLVERGGAYGETFATLRELGANVVALVPRCEERAFGERTTFGERGTQVDCSGAPTDAELAKWMRQARELGLRVMLKPHLETAGTRWTWRGEIAFATEAEWREWFASYEQSVLRFAALEPDLLCIGTELAGTSERADDWRALVRAVRAVYAGPLLYAAHFEEFEQVTWWDALDLIGIDGYFPLRADAESGETVDELVQAWAPVRMRLAKVARRFGKPVVFAEVGYQSRARAYESPWQRDPALPDARAQALAYEAFFEAFEGCAWWRGALWWDWNEKDPDAATGFTPTRKPAEGVLLAHWRRGG